MKFLEVLLLASAFAAVCDGGYPKITAILADPQVYDHRFMPGRYDLNEIFGVNKNISLDAVILPTYIVGPNNTEPYVETYNVLVEAGSGEDYREDVGVGYFNGTVDPGSSVVVPIRSMRNPEESLILTPTRNGTIIDYIVYVEYGRIGHGSYPIFANRSMGFLDIFSRPPQPFGVLVGLKYSHP